MKEKLGDTAQPQRLLERVADESLGALERLHGLLGIIVASLYFHVDARQLAARFEHDVGHDREADARIGELAFEESADLVTQGVGDAFAAMLQLARLRHVQKAVKNSSVYVSFS